MKAVIYFVGVFVVLCFVSGNTVPLAYIRGGNGNSAVAAAHVSGFWLFLFGLVVVAGGALALAMRNAQRRPQDNREYSTGDYVEYDRPQDAEPKKVENHFHFYDVVDRRTIERIAGNGQDLIQRKRK
jgi:hypothetical protein